MSVVYINRPIGSAKAKKKYLYRYMDYEKAISLLRGEKLKFSELREWKNNDPYETVVIDGKYTIDGKSYEYPLKGKVYAMCFTEQYSCEAQWNAYGKKTKRQQKPYIEIKFDCTALISALEAMDAVPFFGKVSYFETNCFKQTVLECFKSKEAKIALKNKVKLTQKRLKLLLRPLLIKRIAFAYENEWRLFLTDDDIYSSNGLQTIPGLKNAIEGVIVGPCDETVFEQVKKEMSQYISEERIHQSYLRKQKKTCSFNLD